MPKARLILFLIVFIDLLGFGIMIPMLPFFARSFGANATEIGALMFVYSFMQIFVAPVWGNLSDRFGRRPILLITILGQSIALIWAGFASTYWILIITRIFAGIFAGNISTASAYMADITKPEERAKGMGLIGAAFGLGFVFGPALGGLVIPYGYEWPSLLAGTIAGLNFILAFFILKEPLKNTIQRKANRKRFRLRDVSQVLEQPKYFFPIFVFFLVTLALVQLEITFGLFVLDRFHYDERQAGLLLALLGIVMAVVQGGLIGKLTKAFSEEILIYFGLIFVGLGLVILISSHSFIGLIFSLLALALGFSLTSPCLSALTSKAAHQDEQGKVLGIYQSGSAMARVLGPMLAGVLYDQSIIRPMIVGVLLVMGAFSLWGFRGIYSRN